ncbi:COA8 family protein CG14806, mitochondrial-like isoform X2 [Photinus pyralis]|uniref:COA8 family protein CG14806, mitochondrial-like isoform X2 n=1 Tax=Photinus pyralis TaxID=7054 RepID=UPI00126707DD|nr:COA8 family protein CG14806, mitochondrial-like isoform X2 [Photinus pyralis]XP_031351703.1 COA8 family protein CG14806, mitochondrial-like isoform X2 [Photinus pyralis]
MNYIKSINSHVKTASTSNLINSVRKNSRNPYAKFLDKCIRSPIIVIPESNKVDIIGPPNSQSNLRPIIRQQLPKETVLQQKLRTFQDETQAWNEDFWSKHNVKFLQQKEEFVKSSESAQPLSSDEMSQFYKKFLDDNWKSHVSYNFEWYKRNFRILYLALRVSLERFKKVSR